MRTDPFTDSLLFFAGMWEDETKIGVWRWLFVVLFAVLLVASVVIATREWRADPAQRTFPNIAHWFIRVLVGSMWFVNTLWKLPLFSEDNGLHYWTEQEQTSAAFAWLRALVGNVFLQPPVFDVINVGTFCLELAFAVSLLLGLGVRAMGTIGVLFVAQLWLGLYRNESEWPWTYVFLMMLMALFAIHASGRRLGLDASLRRTGGASPFSRLLAAAG